MGFVIFESARILLTSPAQKDKRSKTPIGREFLRQDIKPIITQLSAQVGFAH